MEEMVKMEAELKVFQIQQSKIRHPKQEPYPDPRGWVAVGEGGYLKKKLPTSDKLFEEEL